MNIKTSKKLLVFSYNILGDKMEKKLPKIFVNPLTNKINNNNSVYYGDKNRAVVIDSKKIPKENINNKINKIFKSPKYVYKVDVEITTINGKEIHKVIGKNMNNLITIDNKLIPIANIVDIREI